MLATEARRLTSTRLDLRGYDVDDAAAVWAAIEESRASLCRWVPDIGRRRTQDEVRAGLAQVARANARGQRLVLGLWTRDSGTFVGEVGVYDIVRARGLGEVGYWLRATARGQGYATEALGALVEHARDALGLRTLEAHIGSDNHASRRVAEALGFQVTRHRSAVPFWDGAGDAILVHTLELSTSNRGPQPG